MQLDHRSGFTQAIRREAPRSRSEAQQSRGKLLLESSSRWAFLLDIAVHLLFPDCVLFQMNPADGMQPKVKAAPRPGVGGGRTVIDAGPAQEENSYGIGNRIIPDRHAQQPVGGEIEAGYGIGNRDVVINNKAAANNNGARAQRGGQAEGVGTSLCFGSEDPAPSHRSGRKGRAHQGRASDVPDWMGGGSKAAAAGKARQGKAAASRVIDCSPPTSESEPNFAANIPAMSREEFDKFHNNNNNNDGYGIGQRVLPDRHAQKPMGGEVEAGYGIGNRNVPGISDQSRIAGRRTGANERFALSDGSRDKQELTGEDRSRMNSLADARMKARPF